METGPQQIKKGRDLSGIEVPIIAQIEVTDRFLLNMMKDSNIVDVAVEQILKARNGSRKNDEMDIRIIFPFSLGVEFASNNFLSFAFAQMLEKDIVHALRKRPEFADNKFLVQVDHRVMQISKCDRTYASLTGRFSKQHLFTGVVEPGADYFIVDDDSEMGSTVVNAAHFIVQNGGRVAAIAVPAIMPGAQYLKLRDKTKEALEAIFKRSDLEVSLKWGLTYGTLTNNEGILLFALGADPGKTKDRELFDGLMKDVGVAAAELKTYEIVNGAPAQLPEAFRQPSLSLKDIIDAADKELPGRKTGRWR